MAFLQDQREGPIQQALAQGQRQDRKLNLLEYGRLGIANTAKSRRGDHLSVANGGSLLVEHQPVVDGTAARTFFHRTPFPSVDI